MPMGVRWSTVFMALVVAASVSCSVEQTRSAEAPEVDVDVDPGRWPKYDVNWADVEVGTTQRTIQVPVIRVEREPTEITVPYIDINVPGAGEAEDRTITSPRMCRTAATHSRFRKCARPGMTSGSWRC